MTTTTTRLPAAPHGPAQVLTAVAKRFYEGARAVVFSFVHARELVEDVKLMQKLHQQADQCEAADPARAAALRTRARKLLTD